MIYKFIFEAVWHCQQYCINDNLNSSFIIGFFFFIVNRFPMHHMGQQLIYIITIGLLFLLHANFNYKRKNKIIYIMSMSFKTQNLQKKNKG